MRDTMCSTLSFQLFPPKKLKEKAIKNGFFSLLVMELARFLLLYRRLLFFVVEMAD